MNKTLYLTFDDGPNDPYTAQILKLLSDFHAKATFFVCGKNAQQNPQSLKNIAALGHGLGIHTYSHDLNIVLRGGKQLLDEIRETQQIIFQYTGIKTSLYRSPYGLTVPWIKPWLAQNGLTTYHWNIMAFDWWQPKAEFIAQHVISRAFDGAIVLLHDGNETRGGSREQTVLALSTILPTLTERGFTFQNLPPHLSHPFLKDYLKDLAFGAAYLIHN